jgi:hypothetical protein
MRMKRNLIAIALATYTAALLTVSASAETKFFSCSIMGTAVSYKIDITANTVTYANGRSFPIQVTDQEYRWTQNYGNDPVPYEINRVTGQLSIRGTAGQGDLCQEVKPKL